MVLRPKTIFAWLIELLSLYQNHIFGLHQNNHESPHLLSRRRKPIHRLGTQLQNSNNLILLKQSLEFLGHNRRRNSFCQLGIVASPPRLRIPWGNCY